MKKLLLLICFVLASPVFAQHTYYVSKSTGADTYTSAQAQLKSTPWAHMPGMASCTSNCASYSPVAGDRFILYGGDSWVSTDLGLHVSYNGSSGSVIYIGTDQTWFNASVCGASFCRPIFNAGNTTLAQYPSGCMIDFQNNSFVVQYVTLDDIEITGYQWNASDGTIICNSGFHITVTNMYVHGWSRLSTQNSGNNPYVITTNNSSGGTHGLNPLYQFNVIDGSDSPNKDFMGGILHGDVVANNVVRYVYNGLNGGFNTVYGNLVENNYVSITGDHCNMVFIQSLNGNSTGYVYNNVVRHAGCGGGSTLWLLGNANCTSCTIYAYNNVIYDVGISFSPTCIVIGNHPGNSGGPFFLYNNTCEAGGSAAFGNGESPQRFSTTLANNHVINSGGICNTTGTTCTDSGGELLQTTAQANANTTPHFDQYTASETYAYSPVASTNSTVGAGINNTSLCSGSLAALCSDTTYATYNTTSRTVVMRTVNARPSSGAWDIGAFQFGSSPTAPIATFTPSSCILGQVPVGLTSNPCSETLQNTGTANLVVTAVTPGAIYSLVNNTCGTSFTLAPSASCTFQVTATPVSAISFTGGITFSDNAGNPDILSITGIGTGSPAPAVTIFAGNMSSSGTVVVK